MSQSLEKKKIMIIAGETSGDFLGGNLMHHLYKMNSNIQFIGIGGSLMKAEGLKNLEAIDTLSIMGFTQILRSLPKLIQIRKKLVEILKKEKYAGVITIDAPGFSFWLGKKIKKLNVPHIHYVAPTVWAWKKRRAATIAKFLKAVLCLFPFEPPYFKKEGLDAVFVGHPLVEKYKEPNAKKVELFLKKFNLSSKASILCLLPGSRSSELNNHVPIFVEAARVFCKTSSCEAIFIPTVKGKKTLLKELLNREDLKELPPIYIESDMDSRPVLYQASKLALAASGTVTLELACSLTPMVVAYKVSKINALIARYLLKVPYVSMVNILYKKEIVPELIQENCIPDKLAAALKKIEQNPEKQVGYLKKISIFLSPGKELPSKIAAKIVADILFPRDK